MRKLFVFLLLLVSVFVLVGCKDVVESEPVDVTVVEEAISFRHLEVHVIVPVELESEAELAEIVGSVASQTYESYFVEIGTDTYIFDLYIYSSQAMYDAEDNDFGHVIFNINSDMENPGLSIDQVMLTFE